MDLVALLVLGAIAIGVSIALAVTGLRAAKTSALLRDAVGELDALRAQNGALTRKLDDVVAEDKKKVDWLDHQQQEIDRLAAELARRPEITRKIYKILTIGVKWTGKTSLTLKWANPLVDLGRLEGTKIERYERTVSQTVQEEGTSEHVFEVNDWGGEHIVDAQQELVLEEIHGLLLVVDLTGKAGTTVDQARVQAQIREFSPESLRYFFGPKTLAGCKSVVLFINKSDVLSGTPAEVEAEGKRLYQPLIEAVERYKPQIDVKIIVGSATYGHSTHHLFSHFVERILPKSAYDSQLLQRMKDDCEAVETLSLKRPPVPRAPQAPRPGRPIHGI